MMFECNNDSKVYVVCPAAGKTGGLELLHQLVYSLNNNGIKAYIAYTKIPKDRPAINPAYECYVNEYIRFEDIEDIVSNIVVISEHRVELMDCFKNAKVAIWWLSVDNYMKVYNPKTAYEFLGIKGIAWYVKNKRWRYSVPRICNCIAYNFAQSYYAIDFLKNNNFSNVEFLSDYISKDYLNAKIYTSVVRKDIVLYNPKKGVEFSKYLMKLDKNIEWVPLINLTNDQVKKLLITSKVYVDFGNHPGKDRFPREAAYCGCCVITGQKGSAKFYEDVRIPEKYKFADSMTSGQDIIKCIRECFENYEEQRKDFAEYRVMIEGEYEKFNEDIRKIFIE